MRWRYDAGVMRNTDSGRRSRFAEVSWRNNRTVKAPLPIIALTIALYTGLSANDAQGEDMSDHDAIKTTIFDYFEGLKNADRARLEKAFAVDAGHMKGYLKGKDGKYELSVRPMNEVIDDWASRDPNPDMQGRIVAINIYDDIAAQVIFDFDGIFTDAFQLAKVDGEWRIINKFYIGQ